MTNKALTSLAAAVFGLAASGARAEVPKHVILIMMENHGADTIIGNAADAPFINDLVGQKGVRVATKYYGVTHPSLPNYLALASGDDMGIHDDCRADPTLVCDPEVFTPDSREASMREALLTDEQLKRAATTKHLFPGKTFVDQLDDAKHSWKVYMEGLPIDKLAEYAPVGADGEPIAKLYAQKHNPFAYFSGFRDDPSKLARLVGYDGFLADVQNGTLPEFAWISPDQCHDMHGIAPAGAAAIGKPDCAYSASGLDHKVIKLGDDFLKDAVATIRSSPAWAEGATLLIVWDEDDYEGSAGVKGSPIGRNGVVLGGSRTPLIVVSSSGAPAAAIDAPHNHYNLLATLEAAYGVPCLGHACEMMDAAIPDLLK